MYGEGDALGGAVAGWTWADHPMAPGYGHLHRTAFVKERVDPTHPADSDSLLSTDDEWIVDMDDDPSAAPDTQSNTPVLTVQQYIVYSPTFQVPALYFTIHDSSGSPLPLDRLLSTTLFQRPFPMTTTATSSAILLPPPDSSLSEPEDAPAPFPLLSQGDHPILGTPCWYFHPCETSVAVKELMDAREREQEQGRQPGSGEKLEGEALWLRWLKTWFAVLSTVVEMRS
ncbi:hypothetical protein BOTBODRAFT_32364 [Botryobasidium botryosum FD-172 SS1]|uniref:Ubiquitin-like-conjugating enzyme ATG10 n=1 Tax=Botryobasidium botryosum (strain FD-172 SS1) TaxID=930990 RepID=A0A067MRV9_BOTB1|nr:hypothetical protein BOTBODRAFT_32364 [Botryobasidium botryosum FD-172 SS1]